MPKLAYDRRGSGEPLVLIHALGSRRAAWKPIIDRLQDQRELIALDMPGFGDSPPDAAGTRLTVGDHADRIEDFLAELGVERPHIAGNSTGGAVALELGRRGAARSSTAFAPIGFWGEAGKRWCQLALRAGYRAGISRPESLPPRLDLAFARAGLRVPAFGRPLKVPAEEVLATRAAGLSAPGYQDAVEFTLEYRFPDDPGELRVISATVAWGRRDLLLPPITQARRARRLLPWARHVSLPRCGHVPFYDDPELCARVVLGGSRS
jgi:pimeloyl-ACP methyl ester carboxylesterase